MKASCSCVVLRRGLMAHWGGADYIVPCLGRDDYYVLQDALLPVVRLPLRPALLAGGGPLSCSG